MNCMFCGSCLQPFNFLADEPEKHRYHSKARLVGFSNPNGWKCTNVRECAATYGRQKDGAIHYVEATEVRYDHREDLGKAGDIWEIVDEWSMNSAHDGYLNMARSDLRLARMEKDDLDVSHSIEGVRYWAESGNVTLSDLGTSEEELAQLAQTGYESEARTCLELARGMDGHSRLSLYLHAVRNIGRCFWKEPNRHWFKALSSTIFCPWARNTRQDYITSIREYLAKAHLSPSDLGTDEAELARLGS